MKSSEVRSWLRRPGVRLALACAGVTLMSLALGLGVHRAQARQDAALTPSDGGRTAITQLTARCEQAMLLGRCSVMKPAAATAATPESRVFIAGAGEVNADVYAALRQQGDAMCGEVRRQCTESWDGTACRIARSLYPQSAR